MVSSLLECHRSLSGCQWTVQRFTMQEKGLKKIIYCCWDSFSVSLMPEKSPRMSLQRIDHPYLSIIFIHFSLRIGPSAMLFACIDVRKSEGAGFFAQNIRDIFPKEIVLLK